MMTICSDRDDDYGGLVGNRNLLNVAKTNFPVQLHGFRTINISTAIDAAGVMNTSAAANGLVMCRSDEDSSNDDDFIASRVDY